MRPRLLGGAFFLLGVFTLTADPLAGQQPGGRGGFGGPQGGGFGGPQPGGVQPGGFGGMQPGGGGFGGGRGGGGMDPERLFSFASGGADAIDLTKLPPDQAGRVKGMFDRMGITNLPANGVITKGQFVAMYQQAQAAKAAAGGQPGGFGAPQPGGFSTVQVQPGGFTMQPQPGGFGGPQPGGMQMQFGGNKGGGMSDEDAIRRFKESDRNQDGRLSQEEASRTLRDSWTEADLNRDGAVDLDEYRGWIGRRFGPGAQQNGGQFGFGGQPGFGQPGFDPRNGGGDPRFGGDPNGGGNFDPRDPRNRKAEDFTNVGIRHEKLPPGLPDWFKEYDQDKDGNVNMYEWRTVGGKKMDEFRELDANGDGLIAPLELIRVFAVKAEIEQLEAIAAGEAPAKSNSFRGTGQGGFGGRGGDQGAFGGKGGGMPGFGGKGGDTSGFGGKGGMPGFGGPTGYGGPPSYGGPPGYGGQPAFGGQNGGMPAFGGKGSKEERREEKGGGKGGFGGFGKKGG